jgi:hypothetical protein
METALSPPTLALGIMETLGNIANCPKISFSKFVYRNVSTPALIAAAKSRGGYIRPS